jgi:omega-6 fatty acid desaturase (delta-12 desaturase)
LSEDFDLNHLLKLSRNFQDENIFRSWWELFTTTLFVALCFSLTLPVFPLAIQILGSIAFGISLVRPFILYHDVLHGGIFRESKWGRGLTHLMGYFVLRPPAEWNRSHNFHHLHNTQIKTSHIGSYPLFTEEDYKNAKPLQKGIYRFARGPWVIIFGYFFVFAFESFNKLSGHGPVIRRQSALAIVAHGALFFLLFYFGGLSQAFISMIIPLQVACALGAYLFYVQHNFEGAALREDDSWDYAQSAMVSSSCLRAPKWFHWLTGNIGFHHIHHLNPKVPFYNLPKAHAETPEFQSCTYVGLSPKEVIHSLKLKIWSPKKNSWVDFDGNPIPKLNA